jgi:anti-anti-sigma factor
MEITKTREKGINVLELNGRLDTTNYNVLEKELEQLVREGGTWILLDCRRLDYISSSGLRIFLMYFKKLKAKGGELMLCSLQENIRQIFEISNFISIFKIFASRQDALG